MKHLISISGEIIEGSNKSNFKQVLKKIKDQLSNDGWQYTENKLGKKSLICFKSKICLFVF